MLILPIAMTVTNMGCGGDSTTGPSGVPSVSAIQGTVSLGPFQRAVINFRVDRAGSISSQVDWNNASNDIDTVLLRGRCSVDQVLADAAGCNEAAAVAIDDSLAKPSVFSPTVEPGDHTLVILLFGPAADAASYRLEGNLSGASSPTTSPAYTATVSTQQARFLFPLVNQPVWEWNLASTNDNAREYMWTVELQNDGRQYQFGFLLFKFPGSQPRSGDLGSLLRAGQCSVMSLSSGVYSLVAGATAICVHESQSLVVVVNNPQTLQLLLSGRPSSAVFRIQMPGRAAVAQEVQLQYQQ